MIKVVDYRQAHIENIANGSFCSLSDIKA